MSEEKKTKIEVLLPEVIVYGRLPWYKRLINSTKKFINNEILLNKNNIRVKNALRHPEAMDAILEGGNIAGAVASAPLAFYGAANAAPYTLSMLKVTGLAMTPSTWIEGISNASGYIAPSWLSTGSDLALSTYFAHHAGKEFDLKGISPMTVVNGLMSLAPITKNLEAVSSVSNTFRNPSRAISSVVEDFRNTRDMLSRPEIALARAVNLSIRDTKLVNMPIEHVTPNGITIGSALERGSEGFHFSPQGSSISYNILLSVNYPFIRIGTWTYSNNTKPVQVIDIGSFQRGFNPSFDDKVRQGITNFMYINNYEGAGNTSYLTTEPNFGVLLSENILKDLSLEFVFNFPITTNPRVLPNNLGIITTPIKREGTNSDLGSYITLGNPSDILLKNPISKNGLELFVLPYILLLHNYYDSGFYARRLAKAGLLSERDRILSWKHSNLDNTKYGLVNRSIPSTGTTLINSLEPNPKPIILYNISNPNASIGYTTIHEGSHASSVSLPEITLHNHKLLSDLSRHIRPEAISYPELNSYISYITDAGDYSTNPNALISEIGGLLLNAFLHMLRNNLTVDQLLADYDYINTDLNLLNLIAVFDLDYVKKLLAPGGIISSYLLTKNDNTN